jgi:gamma-glutamyltranspeptidase/glutathione hydrolase
MTDPPHVSQMWALTKPTARGRRGLVVAQAHDAAAGGLAILEAGGNAADAAVATAFALAAAEPWNSGLGGIGFALVQAAGESRASVVDFGPVAPAGLDPAAFRLTGRAGGGDLFGWPEVAGDLNIHGPLSVCVPSAVAGYAALHARWGRLPWRAVLEPAIHLARAGLPYDWYAALRVLQSAALLRQYPETARLYMPGGLPRPALLPPARIVLGELPATLERLAHAGAADFHSGDIGSAMVTDLAARGGVLTRADLLACLPRITPAAELPWRYGVVQAAGAQSAGPALFAVLEEMEAVPTGEAPDGPWYAAMAAALRRAQAARLGSEGSTTHLCVVDAEGGMVSMTTTLLSVFGSRLVLPQTGVLMNNGVMWFDPRPGRRNSIRPVTNMCPVLLRQGDTPALAVGASGGRRILPAVAQILTFITDFAMDPGEAAMRPRIDVSDPEAITADARMDPAMIAAIARSGPVAVAEALVAPGMFAAPGAIASYADGTRAGAADIASPWSAALAQSGEALARDPTSAAPPVGPSAVGASAGGEPGVGEPGVGEVGVGERAVSAGGAPADTPSDPRWSPAPSPPPDPAADGA